MAAPDLGVIIVSWNVRDLLRQCLLSVQQSLADSGLTCCVVVVDNASADGTAEMVRVEFPDTLLIANPSNTGFATANNLGMRALGVWEGPHPNPSPVATGGGLNESPRYVMLLNPDTEVVGDALARMAHYLDEHSETVVVGPQLRYRDGSTQPSRRRWPTIMTLFWESTLLEQWWPGNPWAQRYRYADLPPAHTQHVDWLVGAALMARTEAIRRAGGLDEGFFMYSEELEWQERLVRAQREHAAVVYLHDALIIHYEGRSSEQNRARRHINFQRSKIRYALRRWGLLIALTLRWFLLLNYGIQLGIEAAKWLLGHKRSLRAERVRQYVKVLRSGL